MTLEWLGDDGPLVLLAEAHAAGWEGIWRDATDADPQDEIEDVDGRRMLMDAELDDANPRTDYARACALLGSSVVALVPHRGGVALVLETTGHQAALLPSRDGVIVAKWIYAPSAAHAGAVLGRLDDVTGWSDTSVEWDVPAGGVRLYPAASRFDGSGLALALPPGRYAVATASYAPDEDSSFELFCLRAR